MTFAPSFASSKSSAPSMLKASGEKMRESWEENTRECGEQIRTALRAIYPRATAKMVSRDADVPTRTLERILDGTSLPSFETWLRLVSVYPQLIAALKPVAAWADLAATAIETETLSRRLAEMPAKRQRVIDAMRRRP